jgi:hypothetical protein
MVSISEQSSRYGSMRCVGMQRIGSVSTSEHARFAEVRVRDFRAANAKSKAPLATIIC